MEDKFVKASCVATAVENEIKKIAGVDERNDCEGNQVEAQPPPRIEVLTIGGVGDEC